MRRHRDTDPARPPIRPATIAVVILPVICALAAALALSACGADGSARSVAATPAQPPSAPASAPSAARGGPCGRGRPGRARHRHGVWIVGEYKAYGDVVGSRDAPYINSLARQCGSATRFYAKAHPSLPNYLYMTSGSTQGITDDGEPDSHRIGAPSIFSQLGGGWRALQESMPRNCSTSSSGLYAARHNPAVYYTRIRRACARQDVPLRNPPSLSARFTFITPNLCNDMHSCPSTGSKSQQVHTGDRWLSAWIPRLLRSREYRSGRTVIFLTWDEDDYSSDQRIATLVIGPSVRRGLRVARQFSHASLLRTTEQLLGAGALGDAARAPSMRGPFGL